MMNPRTQTQAIIVKIRFGVRFRTYRTSLTAHHLSIEMPTKVRIEAVQNNTSRYE